MPRLASALLIVIASACLPQVTLAQTVDACCMGEDDGPLGVVQGAARFGGMVRSFVIPKAGPETLGKICTTPNGQFDLNVRLPLNTRCYALDDVTLTSPGVVTR